MKNNVVLVIAAHPDDEVLGCGGTIAKHILNGDVVHVHILAQGITSRDLSEKDKQIELSALKKSAMLAHSRLKSTSVKLHDLPDNRMDSLDLLDIVKKVESIIESVQPNILYTHHAGDVNIDHQLTNQAVITACRPIDDHCVKTLLFFEVNSSTEWQIPNVKPNFLPNWFVNIEETLDHKLSSLDAYSSEMRPWPHSRSLKSVEYLARWRGSFIGCKAAEAFMLARNSL